MKKGIELEEMDANKNVTQRKSLNDTVLQREDAENPFLDRSSPTKQEMDSFVVPVKQPKREYYIDWMRFTSVHLVVLVHSMINAMDATDVYGEWAMKNIPYNEEIVEKTRGFIKTLLQCGIPIFFYISG